MKIYADTSFLLKIIHPEPGSDAAKAEFQSLGRPRLPFLPLHQLEAATALRQRAFHARRSGNPSERVNAQRIREAALARMSIWTQRGWLAEQTINWEIAISVACNLSVTHADKRGARSLDLLHVAFALQLDAKTFLTTDHAQGEIARLEGLNVPLIQDQP